MACVQVVVEGTMPQHKAHMEERRTVTAAIQTEVTAVLQASDQDRIARLCCCQASSLAT